MTEPTWRRRELDRKRLERACAKLLAEAVRDGNVQLIRSHRIRLAALRFAFEGSVESQQQLSAFYFEDDRPLNDGDLRSILTIVEAPGVLDGAVLGVVNPSPDDAKEFIFHLSAFVLALQSGARLVPGATPRVRSSR